MLHDSIVWRQLWILVHTQIPYKRARAQSRFAGMIRPSGTLMAAFGKHSLEASSEAIPPDHILTEKIVLAIYSNLCIYCIMYTYIYI